jgi:hypothetical protein
VALFLFCAIAAAGVIFYLTGIPCKGGFFCLVMEVPWRFLLSSMKFWRMELVWSEGLYSGVLSLKIV